MKTSRQAAPRTPAKKPITNMEEEGAACMHGGKEPVWREGKEGGIVVIGASQGESLIVQCGVYVVGGIYD
jgi:hypothetical protein